MKKITISIAITIITLFLLQIYTYATELDTVFDFSPIPSLSINSTKISSKDLDPDKIISFPSTSKNGEVPLTIDATKAGNNYKVYYQSIKLSNEVYENISALIKQYNSDVKTYSDDITTKKEALSVLKQTLDEAKAEYDKQYALDSNSEATTNAKKAYDEIVSKYNAEVKVINDLIASYDEKLDTLRGQLDSLYPDFNDNNWSLAENDTAKYTRTSTDQTESFLIWIKLVKADNTNVYDRMIYTAKATIPDSNDNNTTNTPATDNTINNNTTNDVPPKKDPEEDPTTSDKNIPFAGSPITIWIVLGSIVIISIVSYRKYQTIDK